MPPVRFVERLQRIDTSAVKLRPDQILNQIFAKTFGFFRNNHTTVAMVEVRELVFAIPLDRGRIRSANPLPYALTVWIDKFKLLPVRRTLICLVERSGHFAAADHKESTLCSRACNLFRKCPSVED